MGGEWRPRGGGQRHVFWTSKSDSAGPANMGGGWETRRRRGPGYDWIIVRLGRPGMIHEIQVDTEHYKATIPRAVRSMVVRL